jgi:hypothetical protein
MPDLGRGDIIHMGKPTIRHGDLSWDSEPIDVMIWVYLKTKMDLFGYSY